MGVHLMPKHVSILDDTPCNAGALKRVVIVPMNLMSNVRFQCLFYNSIQISCNFVFVDRHI